MLKFCLNLTKKKKFNHISSENENLFSKNYVPKIFLSEKNTLESKLKRRKNFKAPQKLSKQERKLLKDIPKNKPGKNLESSKKFLKAPEHF